MWKELMPQTSRGPYLILRSEVVREGFSPDSTSQMSTPKLYTSTACVTGALAVPDAEKAPNSSGLMYASVPRCKQTNKGYQ